MSAVLAKAAAKTTMAARKLALRRGLLRLIALGYGLSAFFSLLFADDMASGLGFFLNGVNGYSQFYAIYVGVWLATAGLALLAARPGQPPILGDITAMFVLAQPVGRLLALIPFGWPQGFLLVMCGVEVVGGLVLLLLRPHANR
ncbi:DUF4345 family protein [Janthinobacterium agaricidamnosum]|uniref:Putative membrane protein n=1 Tax=Janthinobacterium agaricidamnosum NBRC 102515 = DSM 9628 TaxID=1349767 RepID=W0V841_9BURK|nr:DUF4345 family protein [Janthinobacterium agaricidamnosum]CDG84974.1 putative membrane protein [Janthinobacterium agaricidamnosum NBRC 102515 = DSM 9628]